MKTPARFKAETKYSEAQDQKANRNLPIMAVVGDGGGTAGVANRPAFYWIRLVADNNRLTQCRSLVPLTDGDVIYVQRARDRKLSHYEFVAFIQDGTGGTTPPVQIHDHHDIPRGGPDLNPETFSPQTVIVGPAPCSYTTLSAAVAAVNAFGPTAANPCTIRVQGIYTAAEAGDVTIPEHCYIEGVGDGSMIDLGANAVRFDSDTGALDIVFTSSRIGGAVITMVGGATNIELRNVKSIATNGGWCFAVVVNDVRLFDCIAEATLANSRGFYIGGTADDVDLEGCTADTTNFGIAFYATNAGTVRTKYCTFRGTRDVQVDAGTTWIYHQDNFDYENCAMNGVAEPANGQPVVWFDHTVTVGAGGDFATPQAALNHLKGRQRVGDVTIAVDAGNYNQAIVIDNLDTDGDGTLIIQGDTRALAGLSYVSGPQTAAAWAALTPYVAGNIVQPTVPNDFYYKCQVAGNSAAAEPAWPTALNGTVVDGTVTWICCGIPNNRAGLTNGGGTGAVCMIAVAGNVITVTMTTTPGGVGSDPNFAADGWVNGDTIFYHDNAGAVGTATITACAANTITIGAGAPPLGDLGTGFTLLPNRSIGRTVAGPCIVNWSCGILLDGLYLDTASGADCHGLRAESGYIELQNVAIRAEDRGILIAGPAWVKGDTGALSFCECAMCAETGGASPAASMGGSGANLKYAIALGCVGGCHAYTSPILVEYAIFSRETAAGAGIAFYANTSTTVHAHYAYAIHATIGFVAQFVGSVYAVEAVAEGCATIGFYGANHGGIRCDGAAARNCGIGYYAGYNGYVYAPTTNANNAGNTTDYSPAVSDTEGNVFGIITWS